MLVSIIIPVFNAERFLDECLKSIQLQTVCSFEAIIVDDGSTDASADILDNWAKKDERFKVIHKSNEGVSVARNIGLQNVSGKYVTFCDSDDFLAPDYLEVLLNEMTGQAVDLVVTYPIYYENGKETCWRSNDGKVELLSRERGLEYLVCADGFKGYVWAKMFNTSIIQQNQLIFDPNVSMLEDLLFCSQYMRHVEKIAYIHKAVYYYRRHADSAVHSHSNDSSIIALKRMLEEDDYSSEEYTKWVSKRYGNDSLKTTWRHDYRRINRETIRIIVDTIDRHNLIIHLDLKGKILYAFSKIIIFFAFRLSGVHGGNPEE